MIGRFKQYTGCQHTSAATIPSFCVLFLLTGSGLLFRSAACNNGSTLTTPSPPTVEDATGSSALTTPSPPTVQDATGRALTTPSPPTVQDATGSALTTLSPATVQDANGNNNNNNKIATAADSGIEMTLSPPVVEDGSGNFADNTSVIRWASIPPGQSYVSSTEYSAGFIGPFVDLAQTFVDIVQPNAFPISIVMGLVDNTFVLSRDYPQLVNYAIGIVICAAFGILFMFLIPIIGCCFCCCRLCGRCGGKRIQRPRPNDCTVKIVFIVFLSIFTAILAFGVIGMILANERMTVAIDNYNTTISNDFGDLKRYLENVGQEINYLGVNNFNFTKNVIFRDLNNIDVLVGVPVRDQLETSIGVDGVIEELLNFESVIQTVGAELLAINSSISKLEEDNNTLATQLNNSKTTIISAQQMSGCGKACQSINSSLLTMDGNFKQLPNISDQVSTMNNLMSTDFSATVLQGRSTFQNIPYTVTNQTIGIIQDLKNSLNNFSGTIQKNIQQILNLSDQFEGNAASLESKVSTFIDIAVQYNTVRWTVCLALSLIVVLVVVLQTIGLCCGIIGHKRYEDPTERSSISNSGGNLLISAMAFFKIFSWILMLVNTILFALGANVDKLICEGIINDPQYTVMKKILDGPGGILCPGCNTYTLGKLLLGNGSIPLTFSETLQQCQNNSPAYSTLKLSYIFNLDSIIDYKQSVDINEKINQINVDLSGVVILSPTTKNQLNELVTATGINYQGFNNTLSANVTLIDPDAFASVVEEAAYSNDTSDPARSQLLLAASQLRNISSGIYSTVNEDRLQLFSEIILLQSNSLNIPEMVNNVINSTQQVQNAVQSLGPGLIKEESVLFSLRLQNTADSFVNYTVYEINNEVGRCLPVWNIWESLGDIAICKYTVDTLNCFWFCIGWSVFFMVPSIIFDVKLAKHFRRMDYADDQRVIPVNGDIDDVDAPRIHF